MGDGNTPVLNKVLDVAKEAAVLAGEQIRGAWIERSEVKDTKSNTTDLVTETDQRCEELVIGLIRRSFPEHVIIGEESAGSDKYELTEAPTWTIDPIDGTTNFVHRLALSCVIISYLCQREVLVSVIYDPMADELFFATRGGGAFLQGRQTGNKPIPIHVSSTETIDRAVVSMDPGYGRGAVEVSRFTAIQSAILRRKVRGLKVLGSTGLNMAYVACGRLDAGFEEGSWEHNLGPKIWDFAAGKLMIKEAGGLTSDISGSIPTTNSLDLLGRSWFAAATEALAGELFSAIIEGRCHKKRTAPED